MKLSQLVEALGGEVSRASDPKIADVHIDSRRVEKGDLFCALPGLSEDGARYVDQALEQGAVAVLTPVPLATPPKRVPVWVHADARRIAGEAAALVHGSPCEAQRVVGVTGTNGKTTVVHLAASLLRHVGLHPGTVGTIEVAVFGEEPEPATHTTPASTELQRICRRNLDGGGDALVLEASSHALDQERLAGLWLDVAIFTNLGSDHLDYHKDVAAYAAAKRLIFARLKPGGAAAVHAEGDFAAEMIAAARERSDRVITYGIGTGDLVAELLEVGPHGTELAIEGEALGIPRTELFLPIVGRHNVENALAALASAILVGADPDRALAGMTSLSPPRGRLEEVDLGRRSGFQVFVDYAHTPDALARVLQTLRDIMALGHEGDTDDHAVFEGRLICVFGCGGNRDRDKRAPMGEVVGTNADLAIVTSDNPRHEDPDKIIAEVCEGLKTTPVDVVVEPDRRAAIRAALREAEPGDVVLIAGKGHEAWQLLRGKRLPFEDRRVVLEELP